MSLVALYSLNTNAFYFSHSVGSNAEFSSFFFDNQYYLILQFKDDEENRLTDNSIVKFTLNDEAVVRFSRYDGSKQTSERAVHWGFGIVTGSSSDKHFAILTVTREQLGKLKVGVDKVAINTIPNIYLRDKWSGKSKFGNNLYEDYMRLKDEFDESLDGSDSDDKSEAKG